MMVDTVNNPPHTKSHTHQPNTNKTFAETTANSYFPKKDQAIVFNTIQDVPQIEYIKAFSQLTPPNNIKFASRISNNRFCIYFASKNIVEQIITKQPYITINNTEISYRRLINPAKRIIISNVQPVIPHDIIEKAINSLSIIMVSPITFMKAGFANDEFGHIGSFRRQMYIHPEHSDKIPGSILLQFDQTEYRIFLSDDTVTCYSCKQTGHTSNYCKNIMENKADSIHFNITNTTPIKNDTDPNKLITQNAVGDNTETDISIGKNPKDTNIITHTTQEHIVQEKRPAPSTSNSSYHENIPTSTPNDLTPSSIETTNIRINTGSLANKLKESAKTPQPQPKKPKRSNSIEQILIKLDEALLPAKTSFEKIPNLKIDFNQLKHIIENSLTVKNPNTVLTPFNLSAMEMIEILETVRPKIKNLCIKNRLTRLANLLLESTSLTEST